MLAVDHNYGQRKPGLAETHPWLAKNLGSAATLQWHITRRVADSVTKVLEEARRGNVCIKKPSKNTTVVTMSRGGQTGACMKVHGKAIATAEILPFGRMRIFLRTCGWESRLTISRLDSFLHGIGYEYHKDTARDIDHPYRVDKIPSKKGGGICIRTDKWGEVARMPRYTALGVLIDVRQKDGKILRVWHKTYGKPGAWTRYEP